MQENKSKDIGALWLNDSKAGTKYMAGNIEINGEKIKIVVFKNTYKKRDVEPDYKIYKSKPMKQNESESSKAEEDSEDIPF